jgi:hypothetical protein
MKKFELLIISNTLQKLRDMNDVHLFLNELVKGPVKDTLFLSYELTLLVYNIILNTYRDYSFMFNKELNEQIKRYVVQQMQRLYEDKLTENCVQKIQNDITYIQTYKTYTYIPDIAMYCYFFFSN